MNAWNVSTPTGASVVDWLWTDVRNGLAHQLSFKTGGTECNPGQRFLERPDLQIEMDPFAFYEDFKNGVNSFFNDLKTDPAMHAAFDRRFRTTLL
jgi:hypothetical protein